MHGETSNRQLAPGQPFDRMPRRVPGRHSFSMKTLLLSVLCVLCVYSARAQQYEAITTLWSSGPNLTNPATLATNLSVTAAGTNGVNATSLGDFLLVFDGMFTNATAGPMNLTYETSGDGVNWNTNKGIAGGNGWFGIPCTNDGVRTIWSTNITVAALGYWRIGWVTNQTGQALTNVSVVAYRKPRRNG